MNNFYGLLKPGDQFKVIVNQSSTKVSNTAKNAWKNYEGNTYFVKEKDKTFIYTTCGLQFDTHIFNIVPVDYVPPVDKEVSNKLSRGGYFTVRCKDNAKHGYNGDIFTLRSMEHGFVFSENQYKTLIVFDENLFDIFPLSVDSVTPLSK